jgi:putative Holliday junction resolvase
MTNKGRILGIDYGEKRIGLAISDENQVLATPFSVVLNDSNTFKTLGEIIRKEEVRQFVIGESVDNSGKLNPLSLRIGIFISELDKRFALPVHKQKEFFTSVEARKPRESKRFSSPSGAHSKIKKINRDRVDDKAAALILQRYLDRSAKLYMQGR